MPDSTQDPNQPKNPYAPQSFTGPFSGAITPQVESAPHQSDTQFSGYGGKGQAVLGLLDKFLAGVGQGRMQRSMAQEVQKNQFTSGFSHWANSVMSDPDVPQEMKAEFEKGAVQAQMAEAADATKDGAKKNPVLGMLNKVFTGMTGGEVTKSKSDIGGMQKFMAEWNAKLHLPQNTIKGQQESAFGQAQKEVNAAAQQAQQSGKPFAREDADKVIQKHLPTFDKLWGVGNGEKVQNQILSQFDKAKAPTAAETKATEEAAREAAVDNEAKGGQPAAQAGQAPSGAPPVARATPPEIRSGAPPAAGATPPAPRPTVYTPAQLKLLRDNKLIGKSEQVVVDGEAKPREMQKLEPYTTTAGTKIAGGWRDSETGEVFPINAASRYREPAKPTAKEAEHDKKAEALYREKHKVPESQKLTETQIAQADGEYASAIEPADAKKHREVMEKLAIQRAAREMQDAGASKKHATTVTHQYSSALKSSDATLKKDREKAQAAFEKAIKEVSYQDTERVQAITAERDQALQDAWLEHKTRLTGAVNEYDLQRGDGLHDAWAENLPDDWKVASKKPEAAPSGEQPKPGQTDPPLVRGQSGSGQATAAGGGKAAMGGYIVGRKYGDLQYLGGDPKDKSNWK